MGRDTRRNYPGGVVAAAGSAHRWHKEACRGVAAGLVPGGASSQGQGGAGGDPQRPPRPPPATRTCEEPASNPPHVWPDDITKWPVRARGGDLHEGTSTGGWWPPAGHGGAAGGLGATPPTWAPLPPMLRSAPTRPKPTTRAWRTWTARSRGGPAASAPRAGGLRAPRLGRAPGTSWHPEPCRGGRGRPWGPGGGMWWVWDARGDARSAPCPERARCLPCAQLRDHDAGVLRVHARLLPRGGNTLLAGERGQRGAWGSRDRCEAGGCRSGVGGNSGLQKIAAVPL